MVARRARRHRRPFERGREGSDGSEALATQCAQTRSIRVSASGERRHRKGTLPPRAQLAHLCSVELLLGPQQHPVAQPPAEGRVHPARVPRHGTVAVAATATHSSTTPPSTAFETPFVLCSALVPARLPPTATGSHPSEPPCAPPEREQQRPRPLLQGLHPSPSRAGRRRFFDGPANLTVWGGA